MASKIKGTKAFSNQNPILMLSEKIALKIQERTEFVNDELEAAVEGVTTATASLVKAGIDFDTVTGGNSDSEAVADSIVDLASEFGIAFPNLQPAQVARVKGLFADVYTAPTPEAEAAGEAIFNATVDFDIAVQKVNEVANRLVAGGDEEE